MKKTNLNEKNFEDEYAVKALRENDYQLRDSADNFDKGLCLDTELVLEYIKTTQPDVWSDYSSQRDNPEDKLLSRIAQQIKNRGVVDVLREGIKDRGHSFDLLAFEPEHTLNPEHMEMYEANQFSVINQLHHSKRNPERSLDVVLFVNGVPLFTMELKNKFTGQEAENAINQYIHTRNHNEPLLKRSIAHFAVDNDEVYYTTKLRGENTEFLPFNKDIENP
ncbi:MAG: type I restriction endonuclease, partial [Candidatus Magasanikbacteria bacterium]